MKKNHRRVLERCRPDLVSDIAGVVEPLLDHLISAAVFRADDDDIQRVRAGQTARERARNLVDILPCCGRSATAFGHFVDALREERPHLAEAIACELEKCKEEDFAIERDTPSAQPCKLSQPAGPPRGGSTTDKLQNALRAHHQKNAQCVSLFDFQLSAPASGLEEVFVTLTALNFGDVQSAFKRSEFISAEEVRQLASKTWSERRANAEEGTDLTRLLRLPDGRVSRSNLLLGRAAGGKTLTLLRLAALWAEGGDKVLSHFEFVFFVSGRDREAVSGKSAIDVLRLDEYDLTTDEQAEMRQYLSENSEKVLVLLDGADEGGNLWLNSQGVRKILRRQGGLHSCSLIVSSRPCEVAYRLIPLCDQHFHIAGLDECHLQELLRRRLGEERGMKLCGMLKQPRWSQLRSLMAETPLVANMVAILVKEELSLPESLTELYTVMVVNIVKHSFAKTQEGHFRILSSSLDDAPARVKASLLNLGKLALSGLKERRYVFNLQKEVQPVCGGDMDELRCGFLEEFRTVSLRGERHQVQFSHLTYQEFLAAKYVAQMQDAEQVLDRCGKEIGFGEETWTFWRFVGGVLGAKNIEKLTTFLDSSAGGQQKALGSKRWQLFTMSCFAEAIAKPSSDHDDTEEIGRFGQEAAVSFLPTTVDLSSHVLTMSETYAVAVCLAHAERVYGLDLSFSDLGDEQVNTFSVHGGFRHIQYLLAEGNRKLHGNALETLASALRRNGRLLELNLRDCNLDQVDSRSICDIFDGNPLLRLLTVSVSMLSSLVNLSPALSRSKLSLLDLSNASLDVGGAKLVGEVLSSHLYLRHIGLTANHFGNEGAEAVLRGAVAVNGKTVRNFRRRVILDNTNLNDGIVASWPAVLQRRLPAQQNGHCLVPVTIHIHGNSISHAALKGLAEQLSCSTEHTVEFGMFVIENGTLRRRTLRNDFQRYQKKGCRGLLRLSYRGIDSEGAAEIATELEGDKCAVDVLSLHCNFLGDEGASVLAQMLRRNSTLRGLGLGGNAIHRPAGVFSTLASTNRSLVWLELCRNPIFNDTKSGFVRESRSSLSTLVAKNQSLKYLGLGQTDLGDEECRALQGAMSSQHSLALIFISLRGNKITANGARALSEGLKSTAVRFVNLSHNALGRDGAAAMAQLVDDRKRRSTPLHRVWMAGNGCDPTHFTDCIANKAFFYVDMTTAMKDFLYGEKEESWAFSHTPK